MLTEQQINQQTMQRLARYRDLKRGGYRHQRDIKTSVCPCCRTRSLRAERWEKPGNRRQAAYVFQACRHCGWMSGTARD